MMAMTGFNDVAGRESFFVLYPNALRKKWQSKAGPSEASEEDIKFTRALIKHVDKTYKLDKERVYATGFSSGRFFSQRLACELSDQIAAIAPVSATIGKPLMESCKPKRHVSVLMINGTADPIITWDGQIKRVRYAFPDANIATVPEAVAFWQKKNACAPEDKTKTFPLVLAWNSRVKDRYYPECEAHSSVEQIVIKDGGHTWPGSVPKRRLSKRVLGETLENLKASDVIWSFLNKHTLSESNSESESLPSEKSVQKFDDKRNDDQ
jgi:polyhydroxybutyrate depolymerase